ncbi:hypothetical protein D3C71_1365380 [compost metagenome]
MLLKKISPFIMQLCSTGTAPLKVMLNCWSLPLTTFACAPPAGNAQPAHETLNSLESTMMLGLANRMKSFSSCRSNAKPFPISGTVFWLVMLIRQFVSPRTHTYAFVVKSTLSALTNPVRMSMVLV